MSAGIDSSQLWNSYRKSTYWSHRWWRLFAKGRRENICGLLWKRGTEGGEFNAKAVERTLGKRGRLFNNFRFRSTMVVDIQHLHVRTNAERRHLTSCCSRIYSAYLQNRNVINVFFAVWSVYPWLLVTL